MTSMTPDGFAVSGSAIALAFVAAGLLVLAFVAGVFWAGRRPVDVLDQFDTLSEVSGRFNDAAFDAAARAVSEREFMRRAADPEAYSAVRTAPEHEILSRAADPDRYWPRASVLQDVPLQDRPLDLATPWPSWVYPTVDSEYVPPPFGLKVSSAFYHALGEPYQPPPMPNCGACKSAMTACTTPAVCRAVARLYPTSTN
jgi:hypothetical protein